MKISRLFDVSGWKLTPKLLMAFLLTAVLPALAASVFSLNYFYGAAFKNAEKTVERESWIARHFVEEVARGLEDDTLLASRENVVAVNLSLGLTAPVLDYFETLRVERNLDLVCLLDAQGTTVGRFSSADFLSTPLTFLTKSRLDGVRSAVSLTANLTNHRVLLVAIVPIFDGGSAVTHYLVTGVDPGSSQKGRILDSIQQVTSGFVVLGNQGSVLGSPPGTPSWDSETRWPTTLPAPGTLLPIQAQGRTYLFGFAELSGGEDQAHPWVGLAFSLDDFQKVTTEAAWGLVLIALTCVTLSFVAAFVFSRTLTRPLLMMARQASAWKEDLGGKRLEIASRDETALLGHAFNEVLDRLDGTVYALKKTQNYLKNIFNSLTSVLVSVDESGVIQEWNVAAERFAGTKSAQALGRRVWELSPVFQNLESSLDKAVATREPQFIKKDIGSGHEKRNFDLCLYPLVWNGVSGAVIRLDDITDSIKKDRQLRQAQKMETIGTLAEGIAHNFNNLLTGITGTVSLVELEISGDNPVDTAQLRHRMGMIEQSTRRAAEIVKRLMGLTRGSPSEFAAVDLVELIREVTLMSRMVLDKSVEVEVALSPGQAPVYADRSQLEQCLLNLLINASHAMTFMRPSGDHSGGTVRVTLNRIAAVNEFLAAHPGAVQSDYWLLQIHDRGVGISASDLPKIFDPFFTTKDMDKGSGLGLAMVYSSIRQHNGFIDVYSEINRGTTVSLYLPASEQSNIVVPLPTGPQTQAIFPGRGLILVVDDEVVVQETARMILTACGYEVLTANNGIEAIALYQKRGEAIRAVLVDSSMPKLSGAETVEALRRLNPQLKVVLCSGLLESSAPKDVPFLPKPYSIGELSRVLFDLLGTQS